MSPASSSPPTAPRAGTSRRLHGLDAARAIAIIGMLAVNVGPRKEPGETELAVVLYDIPYGRASLLFVILAGLGMSLMTKRCRETGAPLPWRTIVWRSAVLIISGLALQMLAHEISVILTYYGVLFLCGLPLLRAPTWLLPTLGAATLVGGPVVWLALQQYTSTTFNFVAPSLTDPFWTILHATLLTGAYPVIIWCTPFLLGLLLGRLNLADPTVQHRLIGWGLITTILPVVTSWVLVTLYGHPTTAYGWGQLSSGEAHSEMPLWMLSGCGSAVFILGVFLRAQPWVTRRLSWLVSTGRLSLTIYVTHLFVLAFLVRPGPDTLFEGYVISTTMSALFVIAAHLWWQHQGTGPLERLLSWPPVVHRS